MDRPTSWKRSNAAAEDVTSSYSAAHRLLRDENWAAPAQARVAVRRKDIAPLVIEANHSRTRMTPSAPNAAPAITSRAPRPSQQPAAVRRYFQQPVRLGPDREAWERSDQEGPTIVGLSFFWRPSDSRDAA